MEVDESSLSISDKILELPGQPHQVSFQHFSGYIQVNVGKNKRALFYYFVEAEVDPVTKPLVLWLNGGSNNKGSSSNSTSPPSSFNDVYSLVLCLAGPGCSSVGVGAFSENGPFKPSGQNLFRNEYSWNRGTNTKNKNLSLKCQV